MHTHARDIFCQYQPRRLYLRIYPCDISPESGEFGSERLVQKVVDTILLFTAETPSLAMETDDDRPTPPTDASDDPLNHAIPTKIILEGQQVRSAMLLVIPTKG